MVQQVDGVLLLWVARHEDKVGAALPLEHQDADPRSDVRLESVQRPEVGILGRPRPQQMFGARKSTRIHEAEVVMIHAHGQGGEEVRGVGVPESVEGDVLDNSV